jgi:hypothetical protein
VEPYGAFFLRQLAAVTSIEARRGCVRGVVAIATILQDKVPLPMWSAVLALAQDADGEVRWLAQFAARATACQLDNGCRLQSVDQISPTATLTVAFRQLANLAVPWADRVAFVFEEIVLPPDLRASPGTGTSCRHYCTAGIATVLDHAQLFLTKRDEQTVTTLSLVTCYFDTVLSALAEEMKSLHQRPYFEARRECYSERGRRLMHLATSAAVLSVWAPGSSLVMPPHGLDLQGIWEGSTANLPPPWPMTSVGKHLMTINNMFAAAHS